MAERNLDRRDFHKLTTAALGGLAAGAACCLASLGIFGAATSTGAIALMCVVLFGHYFLSANMFTAVSDLMPQSAVGRTTALTGIAGGLSGAAFDSTKKVRRAA